MPQPDPGEKPFSWKRRDPRLDMIPYAPFLATGSLRQTDRRRHAPAPKASPPPPRSTAQNACAASRALSTAACVLALALSPPAPCPGAFSTVTSVIPMNPSWVFSIGVSVS